MAGGVFRVSAQSEKDGFYGLGYCHAMDRGIQMMMMKILGRGMASQYLKASDEMLEIDIFFRKQGWTSHLEIEKHTFTEEESSKLQAYCDGANAYFSSKKAWELHRLLGFKEFHWSIEDILLLSKMSGYLTLAQSQAEIEHLFVQLVQEGVPKSCLNNIFPGILGDYDEKLLARVKLADSIVPDAVKWNSLLQPLMASNNWVLSGEKTMSGQAMLANDPHLEINRLPAFWYETFIEINDTYTCGATVPGIPSILIGRNQDLAFGVTYAFMDATDSWVETCKEGQYLKDGEWHDFEKRKEVIHRKNKDDKVLVFYENDHGVLEGDPFEEGQYLARKWSGRNGGAQSIKSGIAMWRARTVRQGMALLGKLEIAMNWVLADAEGNIGYQMSGLFPKRSEGDSGFVPLDGSNSKYDWQGYHDPSDLPSLFNPPEGYIVTANNDLSKFGNINPHTITMGPYRADRIKQILKGKDKHSVEDMQKMHYDVYSLQAEKFMQLILPHLPKTENGEILKKWDLCYDKNSKGAYLFEMIYQALYEKVFGKVLGKEVIGFIQNETGIFTDFYQNFDNVLLDKSSFMYGEESQKQIFKSAIEAGLSKEAKTWGEYNSIVQNHIIFGGQLPSFLGFDKGPFPLMGNRATIHQGQVYRSANRDTSFAPSYRMIADFSQKGIHTNLPGGPSDRRMSKWYWSDFINSQEGKYKYLA